MKVGDRVFRKNYEKEEIEKGTLDTILGAGLNDTIVCIVKWDNGSRTKCLDVDLHLLIEEAPDPDSVTISRSEFHDLTMKIINANNFSNMDEFSLKILQIVGLEICSRIEKEIFGETADND